jgi:hypothetical protein
LGQAMGFRLRSKKGAKQLRQRRFTPRAAAGMTNPFAQNEKTSDVDARGFLKVRGPPPVHPWSAALLNRY